MIGAFPGGYLAIGTADSNIGVVEPTDPGYGRQPIAFSVLSTRAPCANLSDIVFGPAQSTLPSPCNYAGIFSGPVGGNCMVAWLMKSPVSLASGQAFTIPAGTLSLSFFDTADLLVRGMVTFQPGSNVAVTQDQLPVSVFSTATFDVAAAWPSGTPGTSGLTIGPLADSERVDVRRFCGYPAYGTGASGFQSWRFFDAYGTLEYRLSNMAPAELAVLRQKLVDLAALETAIPTAADNLDTDSAAVWKHNRNEVADRMRLFDDWRRRLCAFIGIPAGPGLGSGGGRELIV